MALAVSTVGAVLIAWAVLLGLLLAWLWARGSRLSAQRDDRWPEGEFHDRRGSADRRRANQGPPPGVSDRRAGFDRRAAWAGATRLRPGD
ncbi:MAG: hypothetical protein QOJ12_66 [Thermoleophilales bacterium]|jgi:hypothetical protein|nr:hypothetical protein [Thermoleophilales bacterium]